VKLTRALLFDLDGTLLDSARAICSAAAASFRRLGVRVSEDEIEAHLGAPLDELYAIFVGDEDPHRKARFVEDYIEEYDRHPERHPPPLPGVREGLAALSSRYRLPMAVATAKPTDRARVQVEAAGLLPRFAHVQGTDEGMRPKPDPDVIYYACKTLEVDPERVVMVGDTFRDVHAAKAAGARAVAVAYSEAHYTRALTFGADIVVRSLEELVDLDF
jgi:HAD superfamily hydrolase (TIGR01509 family)